MNTDKTSEKEGTQFILGDLELQDVDNVIEVVKEWVRDMKTGQVLKEEVTEVRGRILSSLEGDEYTYYVLRDENRKAIGCCGIREPEDKMQPYKSSPNSKSVELVNMFLSRKYRGKGLGYKMMENLFSKARDKGFEEVIWNSGPRYKRSAWDFYDKLVGKPVAIAPAFYGHLPNGRPIDAPVWRKKL